jgi:tRNA threonylcarbamoyladenosine biosynthesis protein TsaB
MKILAVDSSGMVASVAVVCDGSLIAEYTINHKKTHSQTLLPMLDEIIRMAEIDLKEIDAIAVAEGPGSFTGLRIGSATVKGLALALDKPIVPVPTLEGLAYNLCASEKLICPIMDARRNQVYTAWYRFKDNKIEEVMESIPLDIKELIEKINAKGEAVIFVGDGIEPYAADIMENITVPYSFAPVHLNKQRSSSVACAAVVRYNDGRLKDGDDFAPVYLRMSQAEREREEKKKAGNDE